MGLPFAFFSFANLSLQVIVDNPRHKNHTNKLSVRAIT